MRYFTTAFNFSGKTVPKIFLLLLFAITHLAFVQDSYAVSTTAGTLNVTVTDAVSGVALTGLKVYAYERLDDGTEQWRTSGFTDNNGSIMFQLDGLEEGRSFFLKTNPYNTGYAYSRNINVAGDFIFNVGTLQVTVLDYRNRTPLTKSKVHLYQRLPDGTEQWAASGYTDTEGSIRFTPFKLGKGPTFFIKTNPYGNGYAYSKEISMPGAMTFEVGTLPLKVTDYFSRAPIAETKVYLYERLADGSEKWAASGYTDTAGEIRFSPFGLGGGRIYFVKTNPYKTGYAYSPDIDIPGELAFEVGTLQIKVIDYISRSPLPGNKVHLYRRLPDGSEQWAANGFTDADGNVRFTPFGLGDGQTYFLKTKPYDTGYAYSKDINAPGELTFNVGTVPVKVTDFFNRSPLAEIKVHLYQRLPDGSEQWAASGNTDANGMLRFTPFGLEDGHNYFVKTNPYGTGYAYSKDIIAAGELAFNVGTLPVKVMDFTSKAPLAETKVYLYHRLPDDTEQWAASGYTDADGMLRFTPFGLEDGRSYFVKTNPYATGYAYSKDINAPEQLTFNVGTLPLKVIDYISQTPLADTKVHLYQRLPDGSEKWAANGFTDAAGLIRFTPFGLENGQTYFVKTNPFATGYAYSQDIKAPGELVFNVGTLQVKVIGFIEQAALANLQVQLYERIADGTEKWAASGYTDANGLIRFTPFGLGDGRTYYVKTKPYATDYAYSEDIIEAGQLTFTAGTLQVKLLNYVDQTALADTKIHLYERLPDGTNQWRANGYTDTDGLIRFTPFGLGDGHNYYLTTKPYNAGNVNSEDIIEPADFTFYVGSSPITLINGDSNEPLPDFKITAYLKLPTGDLQWVKNGYADDTGTVHFDLPFAEGVAYVFYARNLFGEDKKYYSQVVLQKGPVNFIVTVDGANTLDQEPPEIGISSPQQDGNVSVSGFTVTGLASDNRAVERVTLIVADPDKGSSTLTAAYDAASGSWSATVPGTLVTLDRQVVLTATAFDAAENQQQAGVTVQVVEDNEGPVIAFTSHQDNDDVAETGFLLSGTVTDLTGVATLKATLEITAPAAQTLFAGRDVTFAADATWTLAVDNGLLQAGDTLRVTLDATDLVDNASSKAILLDVIAADYSGLHLLNRITFGATPALLAAAAVGHAGHRRVVDATAGSGRHRRQRPGRAARRHYPGRQSGAISRSMPTTVLRSRIAAESAGGFISIGNGSAGHCRLAHIFIAVATHRLGFFCNNSG